MVIPIAKHSFLLLVVLFSGGCASIHTPVQINSDKLPAKQGNTLAVAYTNTYFQPRFMGIFKPFIDGPLGWYAFGNYEGRNDRRLESNEYEKLLGAFDVSQHFIKELRQGTKSSTLLSLVFNDNADITVKSVEYVKCSDAGSCTAIAEALPSDSPTIAVMKMAYGIGMRQGKEQFGFVKSYRPFIRVMGIARRADNHQVIWRDTVIVFGEKAYRGSEANADQIPREELIDAFKGISTDAVKLIVRSLNGEKLEKMPVLDDLASSDQEF